MAAKTERQTVDLMRLMQERPAMFSLGQILRLAALEQARNPDAPPVRVRSWLSLAFPSAEVEAVDVAHGVRRVTATRGGLYSTLGPLPTFYTEELLEEARSDASVSRDFLDILTDRLVQLDAGAARHARLPQRCLEEHDSAARDVIRALAGGADIPELMPAHMATLRLLAGNRRTAEGLARYIELRTGLARVSIEQCVPSRVHIRPEQRCRLGRQCATLGEDAVIGTEVEDVGRKIRIHAHGLDSETMRGCMAGGKVHGCICAAVREYLMAPLAFDIVLHPGEAAAPPRRLGENARICAYLPAEGALQAVCIPSREEHAA